MIGGKELYHDLQEQFIQTANDAEDGRISMLDAFIRFQESRKELETALSIAKGFGDDHMDEIAREYESYPEGYNGYSVEVRNGGRAYNYKSIPEWQEKQKELKECEDKYKQAFISKEKGMLPVSEDGEVLDLPEITYRKSSIILKKKR